MEESLRSKLTKLPIKLNPTESVRYNTETRSREINQAHNYHKKLCYFTGFVIVKITKNMLLHTVVNPNL